MLARMVLWGAVAWLCAGRAHAVQCRDAVFENQRHARVIEHALRQLDRLQLQLDRVEAHNARVYIDPATAWRSSAGITGGVLTASTFLRQCQNPADFDLFAATIPLGVMGGVTYAPLDLKLQIFALGRGDVFRLQTTAPDERDSEVLGQYRGVLGARVQLTRWLAVGLARVATTRDEAEDPALQGVFDGQPSDPAWLFELGIPALGLTTRITSEGDQYLLREAAVRSVPVTDRLRIGVEWASLATEDRAVVTPKVEYAVVKRSGRGFDQGLDTWGEVALESNGFGLRHARVGLTAPMVSSNLTRRSYSRIGADISQRAALSAHTGQQMRAASDATVAVGGQYDVALQLHTPYITLGVDFGLGFNLPEMLDLYPGLANSLTIAMAMRLTSHF